MPPDDFMAFTADTGDSSGYSPSQKLDRNVVVDFWKNKPGVKPHVAEGVADAWNYESGLKPTAVNPTSGAIGVPQYLGSRKAKLFSNENWQNPYAQFNQAWDEVNGGDAIATRHWDEIKSAKTREEAKALWEKYFERPGTTAKTNAPAWNVAPSAIASEQARSNTDVRYMTPEEYLAMLPPLENDAAQKTKRRNLDDSLSSGDDIQSIPSLEVRPKGDSLTVADYDGRNRAQAAIDAGVDQIPVAIRGVPKSGSFKSLIGTDGKKLPYAGFEIVPNATLNQDAHRIAPMAFTQTPPEVATMPQFNQQQPAQPSIPITPPVPTKPDYYPEIAAGINKSIVNPASEAYRGVMPPNPATQTTAANRIAAANANSAGQVGLPPAQPTSSLNSLLSAINPIGTAQAAELSPGTNFAPFTPPPAASPGADFTPFTGDQGAPSNIKQSIANNLPLGLLTVPAANMLSNAVAAPFIDPYALARSVPQGIGGAGQNFNQERNRLLAALQLPMTPNQQLVASIAGVPGRAVMAVANWLLERPVADIHTGKVTNESIGGEQLKALANLVADYSPLLGFSPAARSAAMTPVRGALNTLIKPHDVRAVNAINKAYANELPIGGMPQSEIAAETARRRAMGLPTVPADFALSVGPKQPLDSLMSYAKEAAPLGAQYADKFIQERERGVPTSAGAAERPVGGRIERITELTKSALGSDSADDMLNAASKQINVSKKAIENSQKRVMNIVSSGNLSKEQLSNIPNAIKDRIAVVTNDIREKNAADNGTRSTAYALSRDKELQQLRKLDNEKSLQAQHQAEINRQDNNKKAVHMGQNFFSEGKNALRSEDIDKFMARATDEEKNHFRASVSDIIRNRLGAKEPGAESDIFKITNVKDKLRSTFGSEKEARDYIEAMELESKIRNFAKKETAETNRLGRVSDANAARLHRFVESIAHFVVHPHIGVGKFWGIRALRNMADLFRTSGGIAPRTIGEEISYAMYNPQAVISQRSRGLRGNKPMLLEPPARPVTGPASVQRINNLTKALTPATYFSLRSQPEQLEPQQ